MSKKTSRGLLNCNPGNIEISNEKWQGEVIPGRDTRFKQFQNMAYGYRAIFRLINTYYTKYHLKTVSGIINRWAPPCENNTANYIDFVCKASGLAPNEEFSIYDKAKLIAIVSAISHMENGTPAVKADVEAGYNLAF